MASAGDDMQVAWLLEADVDRQGPGTGELPRRVFFRAVVTLSLSVLGSSILPIPFAMSKTGVLVGCITMLIVAWANSLTARWLIRAAAYSGRASYEGLSEWAGGKTWRVFTQVSLIVLLGGTMCGGLALISDVGYILTEKAYGDAPPPFVSGRTCLVAVTLLVLFPLCHTPHMRQLERAATAGVVIVLLMIGLLAVEAIQQGFPAIADGELPLWSLEVDENLPEAFSVIGYAFYMQPMMMPLLSEMPCGYAGVKMMERVVQATLFGVAFPVYFSMGLFGASIFGQETAGNIMVNLYKIVQGRYATIALYGAMLVYLSFGMTTSQYALRASVEYLLWGERVLHSWRRMVAINTLTIGSALAVALVFPEAAEKIYAVVGATAVCVVCYVIPAFIQLQLYRFRRRALAEGHQAQVQDQEAGDLTAPLLRPPICNPALHTPDANIVQGAEQFVAGAKDSRSRLQQWLEVVQEVVMPVLVVLLGVGFSVAALWVALRPLLLGDVDGTATVLQDGQRVI